PEIDGIQSQGVIAEVKHFAVYNQETNRDTAADNAVVDERTLREIYLPAFEAAVKEAHVGAVMCAYSTVNGTPACANSVLLDQILKKEWGFGGFVTSDWDADFGGPDAANAGLDMQMPDGCFFGPALADAVRSGSVPVARLDDMVRRVLTSMFKAGLIDRPASGSPSSTVATVAHTDVAETAATEGTVLLRNEGALPIDSHRVHTLAIIGAEAGVTSLSSGGGSAAVATSSAEVSALQGLTTRAAKAGVHLVYDDGNDPMKAAATARSSDLSVVFVGRPDTEMHDHTTIELASADNQLIATVAAANPNTVVVLNTGSPVAMPWLKQVKGVLENWYGGQADGTAIASLLFGDSNPSGKLPVTFPVSVADVPAATASQWPGINGAVHYDEGLLVGYRSYNTRKFAPLFPFGFGLSYTNFSFGHLTVTPTTSGGNVSVTAVVTNTGHRSGADVAQLYLSEPAQDGEPPQQLKGFDRVDLAPGQSATVHFSLDGTELSHWGAGANRWVASAGDYQVRVGDSSAALPLSGRFLLTRSLNRAPTAPLTPNPVPPPQTSARQQCGFDVGAPIGNGDLSTPVTP
ncbi:MAG TPA: glycoside hydrolase family 3 C-terminal domain-containing protein, partial [Acidimicrobiales bacterium]